jgi:aspartate/methionine/tyrosine aminotransferase
MLKNLTCYEIDSLPHTYNLTDGHVFRRWSGAEEAIINRSAQLFKSATRRNQAGIERGYIRDFSLLAKQTWDEQELGYLTCFTASMAFEIVANYLRLNDLSLALIEPCFDNLADIFQRHRIPLRPIPDEVLEAPGGAFARALDEVDVDAVCLVTPNNPTGRTLTEDNLHQLVQFCKHQWKFLILDNCFRADLPRKVVHDQYRIVLNAGIDAVLVEDTGKTWPSSEIKAPFFAVTRARGLFTQIYDIDTDFLLHVSPVGVRLVHEFIHLSQQDDLASVHATVRVNRAALYENLEGTFLTPCEHPVRQCGLAPDRSPKQWPATQGGARRTRRVRAAGDHFFWHDRSKGDRFIRVALPRDADVFREAATLLGDACRAAAACPPVPTGKG